MCKSEKAASQTTEYERGVTDAAAICERAAINLLSGKARTNQIDRHTARVLRNMEREILALREVARGKS